MRIFFSAFFFSLSFFYSLDGSFCKDFFSLLRRDFEWNSLDLVVRINDCLIRIDWFGKSMQNYYISRIISFVFVAIFTCQYGHQWQSTNYNENAESGKKLIEPRPRDDIKSAELKRAAEKRREREGGREEKRKKIETRSENAVTLTRTSPAVITITFSPRKFGFCFLCAAWPFGYFFVVVPFFLSGINFIDSLHYRLSNSLSLPFSSFHCISLVFHFSFCCPFSHIHTNTCSHINFLL